MIILNITKLRKCFPQWRSYTIHQKIYNVSISSIESTEVFPVVNDYINNQHHNAHAILIYNSRYVNYFGAVAKSIAWHAHLRRSFHNVGARSSRSFIGRENPAPTRSTYDTIRLPLTLKQVSPEQALPGTPCIWTCQLSSCFKQPSKIILFVKKAFLVLSTFKIASFATASLLLSTCSGVKETLPSIISLFILIQPFYN